VRPDAGHVVQIYRREDELARAVAAYLAEGFAAGEPALVVATPAHLEAFADEFANLGSDTALMTVADADETLAAFMEPDGPSRTRFVAAVGRLLDAIAGRNPARRIRVFGEMVDLLSQRGKTKAAIRLEEFWNDLARSRDFSLLCGYHLDVFDRATQVSPLPGVCRTHAHVRAAADPARLTRAVDRALGDVLGSDQAGKVYLMVGAEARRGRVPVAQLALMWISANMPALADRVLSSARGYYEQARSGPAAAAARP
jgi:hypothetical protein